MEWESGFVYGCLVCIWADSTVVWGLLCGKTSRGLAQKKKILPAANTGAVSCAGLSGGVEIFAAEHGAAAVCAA